MLQMGIIPCLIRDMDDDLATILMVDTKVPRDRNGSFEPKIIGKYSRNADSAMQDCGLNAAAKPLNPLLQKGGVYSIIKETIQGLPIGHYHYHSKTRRPSCGKTSSFGIWDICGLRLH